MLPQRSEEQHQCPLILPVCCLRSEAPLAFPSIWSAHLATSCSSARVSWIFALSLQCIPGLICVQCSRVIGNPSLITRQFSDGPQLVDRKGVRAELKLIRINRISSIPL